MICPICQSTDSRRSRRRSLQDYFFSMAGIVPWRCASCETRFYARKMPVLHLFYAHCAICGNQELKRIAPEHVPGLAALIGRILHFPALRCEPCRHKFFSLRPMWRGQPEAAATTPTKAA